MNNKYDNSNEYIPKHAGNYSYNSENNIMDDVSNEEDIPLKKETLSSIDKNSIIENKNKLSKKKKRKIKKWVWIILFIIFFIITIISLIQILLWMKDNKNTSNLNKEIISSVKIEEIEEDDNIEIIGEDKEEETSDYWYYIKFPLIDVDISKLKEKNADTVGWINVNNTNINYPYVQYKDNDYYLTHSFDKSYNEAGWVFMDYRNNSDLNNKNTIIYAHSRLDKTMFGSLSKVLKKDWYSNKDNHIIRIATEDGSSLWQIFSVYKIEVESYYITTDFASDEEYLKFLDTIKDRSIYNFNTNLSSEDKILTLSTCYSDNVRTVVHAKLIKKSTNN